MGPNFSPVIAFSGNQVIAMGPLGADGLGGLDYVEELRAWIYQAENFKASPPGTQPLLLYSGNDAAATDNADESALRQNPGVCWMLPLQTITAASFDEARAFAVAMALISDGSAQGRRSPGAKLGRVIWWGHPVRLTSDADAFNAVQNTLTGLDGKYAPTSDEFVLLERSIQDRADGRITSSEFQKLSLGPK